MAKTDICKRCHHTKTDGHRHCGSCGIIMRVGVKPLHADGCARVKKIQPWQRCPSCKKLLAAGAWCPEHGNPIREGWKGKP